ncbi:MAG: sulfotransferase domain-containing protein [Pirellulaceae bacterium]
MRTLTWLASFPKSGNTWVRAFLTAYLLDADRPLDLKRIYEFSASESRYDLFVRLSGKRREELTDIEIDAHRRWIQEHLARDLGKAKYLKTHNARVRHFGYPLIRSELTRCAVYLLRNPLDVVDSFADHAGLTIDEAIAAMNNPSQRLGGPNWPFVAQYITTWSQHVVSWTARRDFPLLTIRYEDLQSRPLEEFSKLIEFLDWDLDQDRLQRAVRFSSFDVLQEVEQQDSFAERSPSSVSGRFFRRGKVHTWTDVLTPAQVETVIGQHGKVMASFGYPTSYQQAIEQAELKQANS